MTAYDSKNPIDSPVNTQGLSDSSSNKAVKDKIFCVITGHKNMPLFQLSCQLYLLFLKDNAQTSKVSNQSETVDIDKETVVIAKTAIDPEDVISWLMTQPNAYGSLYLESVARGYMGTLRNAPPKLNLDNIKNVNVFECHSVEALDKLVAAFKSAPNYAELNKRMGHGQLSAGLAVYRRYLEHIERKGGVVVAEPNIITSKQAEHEPHSEPTANENRRLYSVPTHSNTAVLDIPVVNDVEIRSAIDLVLSEKFSNGFAYTSPIQVGRLRRFVGELVGKDLDATDEAIVSHAKQSGTVFGNRVYVVSGNAKEQIRQIADKYFSCGAEAIFYEAFFEKHEHFLMDASVVSVDMLRRVFQKLYPQFYSNETYFGSTFENINAVITNEILRVWNGDSILKYSQIAERLPCIPFNRIKFVLGQNGDFIINRRGRGDNDGECIHISKVYITETEKAQIRDLIENGCNSHRYISLANLELNGIAEKNYELSISAIQTAVFQICCAGTRYERHGKIVTRRGEDIDALYIMKEFCRTQDKITLDDLLDFESELTGEQHRWIPMQAGYDTMVRIDEQVFVADWHLDFDTNVIDNAIEHFMNSGEYLTLQSVTTFALFPYCGQSWNLYLLESYCRRFSPNFRFETRAVNSKNTGAIIRKNSRLTYDDIMGDYVARSNVALTKQAVLDYLFDNGLVSVRKHKDIDNLIRTIRKMRERMG
jgi:hypothetical protein